MARSDGPRQPASKALSAPLIVARAIELADAAGIGAVSMRKLSAEFHVTPMALYWHFKNRNALLDAMAESVAESLVFEDDATAPWEQRLNHVLRVNLDAFVEHRWLPEVVKGRIVPSPNYLAVLEALLDAIISAGFEAEEAASVAEFLMDSLGSVAQTVAARGAGSGEVSPVALAAHRERVDAAAEAFPRVREALQSLTDAGDRDAYAELAIGLLVSAVAGYQRS